jgi:hypothetical protein
VNYDRLDGAFHRFALGERKIGLVAKSGEPLLLAGLRGDEKWVADRAWIEREGVGTVAAQPLVFRADILGVLALFDRGVLDGAALEWLRVFADYAAVSIANARAFEEIEGFAPSSRRRICTCATRSPPPVRERVLWPCKGRLHRRASRPGRPLRPG